MQEKPGKYARNLYVPHRHPTPMHRGSRILATLAVLMLSGCLAASEEKTQDPIPEIPPPLPPVETGPIPWLLTECDAVIAAIPIAASALEPFIPEGFRLLTPEEAGLPPGPLRGNSVFGVEAFQCESGTGLEGNLTDVSYGSYFTFVEPPAGLVPPGEETDLYFIKWHTLIDDPDLFAELDALGAPVTKGSTKYTRVINMEDPPTFEAILQIESDGTTEFAGSAPADQPESEQISFTEWTAVESGFIRYRIEATWDLLGVGTGTVSFTSQSWAAQLTGRNPDQAYYFAGRLSFTDGLIALPDEGNATMPPEA